MMSISPSSLLQKVFTFPCGGRVIFAKILFLQFGINRDSHKVSMSLVDRLNMLNLVLETQILFLM